MKLERLNRADVVAALAALALLLVMALDWYSTTLGDTARRIEDRVGSQGATQGEVPRAVEEQARRTAEAAERNAWDPHGGFDVALLAVLLGAVAAALTAAVLRAAGRRVEPPLSPTGVAAALGALGALLVAYRIVQEPGFDAQTTVQAGAPLALAVLAVLTLAAVAALLREQDGSAWKELPEKEEASAGRADSQAGPSAETRPT